MIVLFVQEVALQGKEHQITPALAFEGGEGRPDAFPSVGGAFSAAAAASARA